MEANSILLFLTTKKLGKRERKFTLEDATVAKQDVERTTASVSKKVWVVLGSANASNAKTPKLNWMRKILPCITTRSNEEKKTQICSSLTLLQSFK